MKGTTNNFGRDLEHRFRKRVSKAQTHNDEQAKRLDLEDLHRRIATYKQRWGEEPQL